MKIEVIEIAGFASALKALHLPFGGKEKSEINAGFSLSLDRLYEDFAERHASDRISDFHLAQRYMFYGKEVNFWRTVETSINSLNYFTDGTCSDEYFIVEGYLKYAKQDKI